MRLSGAEPISQVNYNGCLPVTCASRSVHGLEKCTQNSERSGIAYTIYTNKVNLPKNGRGGLKLVSNGGFEEMEHEFPFERFRPEKTGLPFQMFRCSRKFSAGTTQDVLFHLLSNRIFWKLFENSKQPITAIIKNMESYFLSPKVSSNLPTQSLIDWLPFCKVLVPAGHALQLVICSVSW